MLPIMKRNRHKVFFIPSLVMVLAFGLHQGISQERNDTPFKIACIGNSITYGLKIQNRERNAYPAQLQEILGKTYEVRNFGINSRTLLQKGDKPYIAEQLYQKALAFDPDLRFINLGSNDSNLIGRLKSYASKNRQVYQLTYRSYNSIILYELKRRFP